MTARRSILCSVVLALVWVVTLLGVPAERQQHRGPHGLQTWGTEGVLGVRPAELRAPRVDDADETDLVGSGDGLLAAYALVALQPAWARPAAWPLPPLRPLVARTVVPPPATGPPAV